MLTFEDFEIDYPQLIGNIRGTGTDFRWVGELQAVGCKNSARHDRRTFYHRCGCRI